MKLSMEKLEIIEARPDINISKKPTAHNGQNYPLFAPKQSLTNFPVNA